MQSTSGTSHPFNKEEMTGEQQINQTGQGVSDIDLDWVYLWNNKKIFLNVYFRQILTKKIFWKISNYFL